MMLPLVFFGQNFHFAANLFAALVCFSVFWLYFDAWLVSRQFKELVKWLGFILLSVSFVIHATITEQVILGVSLFGHSTEVIATFIKLVGYGAIIWAQAIDPLQLIPKTEGLVLGKANKKKKTSSFIPPLTSILPLFKLLLPVGAGVSGFLYWRRATIGLERHLKPIGIAFFLLSVSESLSLASFLRGSSHPTVYNLVAPFGPIWIVEHLILLVGIGLLGKWVWNYLITRLQSQLFIIFDTIILIIFLVTTMSFTFLLLGNVQKESLANLETAANVLDYAITGKKAETASHAESIAQNSDIVAATSAKNHRELVELTENILESKKTASIIVTDESGQVLVRAEDSERWGDSLSEDSLVKRTLIGQTASSVTAKEDVLAPLIFIKSAFPIRDASRTIVGSATVGLMIDSGFVDGIKKATGLDSAVYAANVRSATTFISPDGIHRWVGILEENQAVKKTVLQEGKIFQGSLNVLNRPFLAVYAPLKDVDNVTVGMLFVGRPQVSILQTAGRSIELTFFVATALLLLSVLPAYFVSKYLTRQLS